jgi:hypothetical protein
MSRKILPLLFLLLLGSCAQLTKQLKLDEKTERRPRPMTPISCQAPTQDTSPGLVGSASASQQAFSDFLRQEPRLDFVDQVVLWALFQIKVRPDYAGPTARLQFLSRTSQGTRYWDFTSQEGVPYPYFHGLSSFLKAHKKTRPLSWYGQKLDGHFQGALLLDAALEEHLLNLREVIASNPTLRQFWFRGDELLREGERLPRITLAGLIRDWEKRPTPAVTAPPFFSYRRTPRLEVSCNYDLTLYDNSIFLIDKEENHGHQFGISWGDQSFLAVSSQHITNGEAIGATPLFQGSAKVRSSAFCVIQRPEQEVWLTANQSRDPGQHVYHLFRYGLGKVETAADLERLLRHARHMFLSDPLRLVIESTRSRDDQIRELLKLNVPIYNAQHIGNIWAWSNSSSEGAHFFIDDRNAGALLCPR